MMGILRQWAFTVGWAVVIVVAITVISIAEDGGARTVIQEVTPPPRIETELIPAPTVTVTVPPPETLPEGGTPSPSPTGEPEPASRPQPSPTGPSPSPSPSPSPTPSPTPAPTPHNRARGLDDGCVIPQHNDPGRFLLVPCQSVHTPTGPTM